MGTTLTGKTIASTYTSLLKISDNGNVGGTIKRISDGAGNDSSVYLSSTQLLFSAGSASVPGLSINGTATTGLYAPSDNEIGITISGTQRGLFTSSGLTVTGYLKVTGAMYDSNDSAGTSNQVLTSTGSATDWKTLSEIAGVDGTGSAGYISKWTDTDTIGNSVMQESSINIGVNTSPSKNLHIKGASSAYTTLRIETGSDSHGSEVEFADSTDADYGSILQFGSGAGEGGRMRFRAGAVETMNLRGGSVGIGDATNPSSTIGYAKVLEIKGASSGIAFSTTSYNNFEIGTGSDSKLTISDGGSERMSIASDGTTTFGVAGAVVKVLPSSGQARFLIESPSVNGNNVYLALKSPDTEWRWITNRGDLNSGNQGDLFLREETAGVNVLNFETNNGNATFAGSLKVSTIAQIGSDTDKFLMSDGGLIKYVSGANLLSYIGAAPSSGGAYLPLAGGTMTGHLILNNAVELQSKNAAGTAKTIARITSGDVLQYGWSGSGEVQFMGGGAYTKRMGITTDGQIEITSDDTHTPFIINHAGDITPHAAGRGQLSIIGNSYEGWIALDGTAMYIGNNSSSRNLVLQTNTTDRLTIDGSTGNATFAGNVDVNGTEITVGGTGSIFAENNIRFKSSGAAYIDHNTTSQSIIFRTSTSSSLDTTALTITNAGAATFASTVTTSDVYGTSSLRLAALGGTAYLDSGSGSSVIIRTNGTTTALTLDSSQNATFAGSITTTFVTSSTGGQFNGGNLTISSSTNRSIILDYTSGSGGYTWASFKQSGTEQFRIFGSYDDDYLSFYNDQTSAHQLMLNANGSTTFGGDVTVSKAGAAITINSTSGTQGTLHIGRSADTKAKITSGDTAASDLCLYTNGTRALTILSNQNATFAGNVGIGVTPEAWTVFKTSQIGQASAFVGRISLNQTDVATNFYYDGAEKRITTGYAQRYTQTSDGKHQFWTAGTDSADSAITFSNKFEIANDGTATFAGDVALTGSGDKIISAISSDDDATLFLSGAGSGKDVHIVYGNDRDLFISKSSSSTATSEGTPVLTLGGNSNATFAGTITTDRLSLFTTSTDRATVQAGSSGTTGHLYLSSWQNTDEHVLTWSGANNGFYPQGASGTFSLGLTGNRWSNVYAVALTASGEVEGGSLDINGVADISGNATFAGAVTVEGSLALGKADTASGHINAKELMTFNIDTDNDDTNRYFAWYTNGADGSGTELLKILETGNATFAGQVTVNEDWVSNEGSLSIVHSQNTLGGIGIVANGVYKGGLIQRDGTSGDFTELTTYTSQPLKLRTNNTDAVTIDTSQNATFAGNISTTGDLTASQLTIDDYIYHAGNTNTYIYFETDSIKLRTGGTDRLTLNSAPFFNDKLGVGMTPVEVLDIKTASGDCRMRLDAPASSDTEIKFFNAGVAQYTIGHDDATDNFVIGGANVDAPMVSVDKSGHVGIGTTPQNILHVHQSDASEHSYVHITQEDGGSASTDGMSIGVLDGGVNASVRLRENGYLNFFTNNTERMRIASSGNVEIKTTNGEINFDSGNGYVQTTTGSTSLVFGVNSSEKIRIHSSGNVGIGGLTAPPSVFAVKGSQTYGMARLIPSSANGEVAIGFFADTAGTTTGTSWVAGVGGWGNTNKFVIGYAGTGKSNLTIDTSGHSTFYGNVNADNRLAFKESNFGYSSSYKVVQYGTCGSTSGIALGVDLTGNSSGGFTGNEIVIPNNIRILAPNAANNAYHGVLMFDDDDDLLLGATNYNIDSTYALKLDGSNNNATFAGTISSKDISIKQADDSGFDAGLTIERSANTQKVHIGMDGGAVNFNSPDGLSYKFRNNGSEKFTIDSAGNITTQSRITFDYGGDHYMETGTNTLSFKASSGTVQSTFNFSDLSATFAGSATIETGINLESGTLLIKNATGDSNGLRIYQDSSDTARIYNYYDGPLVLGQNNAAVITIGADTNTTFAGNVTTSGEYQVGGVTVINSGRHASFVNLTTTGDNTLGNATSDSTTINGKLITNGAILGGTDGANGGIRIHSGGTKFFSVDSSNAATNNVMDVGASDAKFKDAYFGGTVDAATIGSNTAALRGTSLTIDSRLTLHDGEIDNNSGDLTLDSVGDIILDADGGDVMFRDGGTGFIQFTHSSGDAVITSNVDDKDIIFKGYDGGSLITALTLDMSEGGNATFAGSVAIGTTPQFNRELLVKGEIAAFAQDSGDNQILMGATSTQTNISATYGSAGSYVPMQFETGGAIRMSISEDGEVGIGTTPASGVALDIREDSTTTAVDVRNANASGYGLYVAGGDTSAQYAFKAADYNNNTLFTVLGDGVSTFNYRVNMSGNLYVTGSVSKGSGSFKIDHPLEDKKDTHHLVHSFIEGPQADLIYRGMVDLVGGTATINIDTEAGMSEGTFVLLNTNTQCFTSNETNWDAVKGKVEGNILTIECQNSSSTATVSWMVVGERQDQHMIDTNWTDENGKVIVEPLKEI